MIKTNYLALILRLVFTLACVYLCSQSTHAAFILDDFDDSAEVASPEMEGELVTTENVGNLRATRNLLVFGNGADPEANLDSNITSPSQLTGKFIALNPNPNRFGLGRLAFSYTVDNLLQDFTESGANNAIFIDISSITGDTPPPLMMILVENTVVINGSGALVNFDDNLPSISPPSTLVLPFAQFTRRSGGPPETDFTTVSKIFFNVFSNGSFTGGVAEQGWTITIDRIRVGMIPEPSSLILFVICLCACTEPHRYYCNHRV